MIDIPRSPGMDGPSLNIEELLLDAKSNPVKKWPNFPGKTDIGSDVAFEDVIHATAPEIAAQYEMAAQGPESDVIIYRYPLTDEGDKAAVNDATRITHRLEAQVGHGYGDEQSRPRTWEEISRDVVGSIRRTRQNGGVLLRLTAPGGSTSAFYARLKEIQDSEKAD